MSRVTVVGTGYVGTVTAVCLAFLGHDVVGLDVSRIRAEQLAAGQVPFHEPGLPERLRQGLESGRLSFTSDPATAAGAADVIFLCVGTPAGRLLGQDFAGGRPGCQPQLICTDLPSAEMVKYAANAFLATKISFANEIANLCELVGADARQVLSAIGADSRIGPQFLRHGIGWGGSCFGKDLAALIATGLDYGYGSPILRAVVDVNQDQRVLVLRKLQAALKTLKGRRIAVFGLAFKPDTDDLRDAPSIEIIRKLHAAGAVVSAYDPIVKEVPELDDVPLRIGADAYDAANRADAVVIATEWPHFAALDLRKLRDKMRGCLILDGRGMVAEDAAAEAGLTVSGFGR
jgi:UDPglucose 6-dehydrogenase